MTQAAQKSKDGNDAYVVRRPRASDALGKALRATFQLDPAGDEFALLLARLDRCRSR